MTFASDSKKIRPPQMGQDGGLLRPVKEKNLFLNNLPVKKASYFGSIF